MTGGPETHTVYSAPEILEVVTNRPEILAFQVVVLDLNIVHFLGECYQAEVVWACLWVAPSLCSLSYITDEGQKHVPGVGGEDDLFVPVVDSSVEQVHYDFL